MGTFTESTDPCCQTNRGQNGLSAFQIAVRNGWRRPSSFNTSAYDRLSDEQVWLLTIAGSAWYITETPFTSDDTDLLLKLKAAEQPPQINDWVVSSAVNTPGTYGQIREIVTCNSNGVDYTVRATILGVFASGKTGLSIYTTPEEILQEPDAVQWLDYNKVVKPEGYHPSDGDLLVSTFAEANGVQGSKGTLAQFVMPLEGWPEGKCAVMHVGDVRGPRGYSWFHTHAFISVVPKAVTPVPLASIEGIVAVGDTLLSSHSTSRGSYGLVTRVVDSGLQKGEEPYASVESINTNKGERGDVGPQGAPGPQGMGLAIVDEFDYIEKLVEERTPAQPGAAFRVRYLAEEVEDPDDPEKKVWVTYRTESGETVDAWHIFTFAQTSLRWLDLGQFAGINGKDGTAWALTDESMPEVGWEKWFHIKESEGDTGLVSVQLDDLVMSSHNQSNGYYGIVVEVTTDYRARVLTVGILAGKNGTDGTDWYTSYSMLTTVAGDIRDMTLDVQHGRQPKIGDFVISYNPNTSGIYGVIVGPTLTENMWQVRSFGISLHGTEWHYTEELLSTSIGNSTVIEGDHWVRGDFVMSVNPSSNGYHGIVGSVTGSKVAVVTTGNLTGPAGTQWLSTYAKLALETQGFTVVPISEIHGGQPPKLFDLVVSHSPESNETYGRIASMSATDATIATLGRLTSDVPALTAWPIGSIHISTNTANPSTYLGGTWQAFGQGRVLLGVGPNEANSSSTHGNTAANAVNVATAGVKGGAHQHTLAQAELAMHSHGITDPQHTHTDSGHTHVYDQPTSGHTYGNTGGGPGGINWSGRTGNGVANIQPRATGISVNNFPTTGTQAHNNMMPHIH